MHFSIRYLWDIIPCVNMNNLLEFDNNFAILQLNYLKQNFADEYKEVVTNENPPPPLHGFSWSKV